MPLLINKKKPTKINNHTLKILKAIKLKHHTNHHPSKLSNDKHQHITITHTLINNPHLILTNKPTNNLNTHNTNNIFQLLKKLNHLQNTTFLIITHNLQLTKHINHQLKIHNNHLTTKLNLIKTK